ncbi:kinase-like domain-containing protein [Rhizophagus clarus]|uniref:Kinase-like domain-containing protein n=1 Tax=Rhizophagus clarus TaxID=94130 RepID=A0A8H3M778_9GLOM|nr:kinase-like domain-containing protein [Rhizophagus clarus]
MADIYSLEIVMNEPKISEDIPEFIADLIVKLDAKAENRPTAKELFQLIKEWYKENKNNGSEIHSQMKVYEEIRRNKLKNVSKENESEKTRIHSQAIYTSRFLSFNDFP